MSIQNQSTFWFNNVSDFPKEEFKERINASDALTEGLTEFRNLLKNIYKDYHLFEVSEVESVRTKIGILADDLENYHNLTNTAECLYQIASLGELNAEGEISFIKVDKLLFKSGFKKPAAFFFEVLEKYHFYFRYYKAGKEVNSYKLCDTFHVFCQSNSSLLSAMKYLSDHLPVTNVKDDYTIAKNIFLLADYESILLNKSTKRKDIDPLRIGIRNTAGSNDKLWAEIVKTLCDKLGMDTDISLNTYAFPNWTIRFKKKGKTFATFSVNADYLEVRVPLSYPLAKELVDQRATLVPCICESIQNFGCVRCGKCSDKSNIELYKGIMLCKLNYSNFVTEDSRCIRTLLRSTRDVEAVCEIIERAISL